MTNYIEFSTKIKEKYPQYKDVDDLVLAQKMVEKYPEYKEKVTFEEVKQEPAKKGGIDLTPSGLVKGGLASVLAPVRSAMYGEDYKTARENALANTEKFKPVGGAGDFLVDLYGYSQLPVLRGGGAARFLGNAAIQGGIPGAAEALKRGGNAVEGAGVGTGIAAALQGVLPQGGKLVSKILESDALKGSLPKILEGLTSVPADYSGRALEKELAGNSILNGKFDAESAYIPVERKLRQAKDMLPTAEDFAGEYYKLGKKATEGFENLKNAAGEEISNMLGKLNNEPIDIGGLKNSINSLVNSYAKGGDINPATVRAGRDIEAVKDLLGVNSSEQISKKLGDFFANNRLSKEVADVLSPADKEAQDVAFSILSQATGKNKQWLKSQLNANMPKMSTQKRQEFIENLLEHTDDKIETGTIDPTWYNHFPELQQVKDGTLSGTELAEKAFQKILGKDFKNPVDVYNQSMNNMLNSLDKKYDKILFDLTKNPTKDGIKNAFAQFEKNFNNLDSSIVDDYAEKLVQHIDGISNIANNKIKPIDLHNAKEILYDMANYDTAGGTRNDVLKGVANQINNFIRNKYPEYKQPNDIFSLIKGVEKDAGGLNINTLGKKIADIGSKNNLVSGLDARLKNIDNLLPAQSKFFKQAQGINAERDAIDNIMRTVGQQYERNPRLLANRTDEAFENAINDLQKRTGVNFMDELADTRAREALEKFFPGQGGGSGSSQGFGNLLRTAIIGGSPTTAVLTGNPAALAGLALVSPKLMAKGTIKNIGKLNDVAQKAAKGAYEDVLNRLTQLGAKGAANMLFGGVEYNDYK